MLGDNLISNKNASVTEKEAELERQVRERTKLMKTIKDQKNAMEKEFAEEIDEYHKL
jgi:hypothetical protein